MCRTTMITNRPKRRYRQAYIIIGYYYRQTSGNRLPGRKRVRLTWCVSVAGDRIHDVESDGEAEVRFLGVGFGPAANRPAWQYVVHSTPELPAKYTYERIKYTVVHSMLQYCCCCCSRILITMTKRRSEIKMFVYRDI